MRKVRYFSVGASLVITIEANAISHTPRGNGRTTLIRVLSFVGRGDKVVPVPHGGAVNVFCFRGMSMTTSPTYLHSDPHDDHEGEYAMVTNGVCSFVGDESSATETNSMSMMTKGEAHG